MNKMGTCSSSNSEGSLGKGILKRGSKCTLCCSAGGGQQGKWDQRRGNKGSEVEWKGNRHTA